MAWTSQADSLELGPSQCPPGLPAHGHPGGGLTELFPNFIPKEKTLTGGPQAVPRNKGSVLSGHG